MCEITAPKIHIHNPESIPGEGTGILRWIIFFLSPYKKILIIFFLYRIFRYTILFSFPTFVGYVIDGLIKYQNDFLTSQNFYISLIYLAVYVVLIVTPFLFSFETIAYENANRSLSLLGVHFLNSASIPWHVENSSGKKIDFIESARIGFGDLMILFRWQIVPLIGTLLSAFVLVLFFNGPLYYSFFFILFVFSFILTAWHFGKPLSLLYMKYREINARVISRFYEMSSSFITIRSLNLVPYLEKRTTSEVYEARNGVKKIVRANFIKWTMVNGVTAMFLIALIMIGYFDLRNAVLTPGMFSALLLLFSTVWNGLDGLSVAQDKIYDYFSSLKRFTTFCHAIKNSTSHGLANKSSIGKKLPDTFNSLELKNVSFSYPSYSSTESPSVKAIESVSFTLMPNQKLALVGVSGAGKSTLVKIILGLYDPIGGSMFLNDIPAHEFTKEEWLRNFSYVPQEIEIFEGTIRENIILGIELDENHYSKVISRASLHEFISTLPDGDMTLVGERGLKLSGGQRQRIGIARALIRNTKILILDEASSSLDSITENKIQNTLFKELNDISLIIIAHRLSTIKCADHLLVMDKGKIVESGSFEELKNSAGQFSAMWGYAKI
jgi:ATP-binding cassette subfamily B protein